MKKIIFLFIANIMIIGASNADSPVCPVQIETFLAAIPTVDELTCSNDKGTFQININSESAALLQNIDMGGKILNYNMTGIPEEFSGGYLEGVHTLEVGAGIDKQANLAACLTDQLKVCHQFGQ